MGNIKSWIPKLARMGKRKVSALFAEFRRKAQLSWQEMLPGAKRDLWGFRDLLIGGLSGVIAALVFNISCLPWAGEESLIRAIVGLVSIVVGIFISHFSRSWGNHTQKPIIWGIVAGIILTTAYIFLLFGVKGSLETHYCGLSEVAPPVIETEVSPIETEVPPTPTISTTPTRTFIVTTTPVDVNIFAPKELCTTIRDPENMPCLFEMDEYNSYAEKIAEALFGENTSKAQQYAARIFDILRRNSFGYFGAKNEAHFSFDIPQGHIIIPDLEMNRDLNYLQAYLDYPECDEPPADYPCIYVVTDKLEGYNIVDDYEAIARHFYQSGEHGNCIREANRYLYQSDALPIPYSAPEPDDLELGDALVIPKARNDCLP